MHNSARLKEIFFFAFVIISLHPLIRSADCMIRCNCTVSHSILKHQYSDVTADNHAYVDIAFF